jgi:hypothetical protein
MGNDTSNELTNDRLVSLPFRRTATTGRSFIRLAHFRRTKPIDRPLPTGQGDVLVFASTIDAIVELSSISMTRDNENGVPHTEKQTKPIGSERDKQIVASGVCAAALRRLVCLSCV